MDYAGTPMSLALLPTGLWLVLGNAAGPAWPLSCFRGGRSSHSNSCHDSLSPFPFPHSIDFPWWLWCCWQYVYRQLKLINCRDTTEAP